MIAQLPRGTKPLLVSYLGIRRTIGAIGLALPVVLGPVGWFLLGIPIQDNMSSYYHTPLRDVFVGSLCSIGVFLFVYRGYDWVENWTGNLGCLSALGLAFCPLDADSDPMVQRSLVGYLHSFSGGVFFCTLAFYSLVHFPTASDSEDDQIIPHNSLRNLSYRLSGIVIIVSMIAMGIYLLLVPIETKRKLNEINFLFWGEWVAVWAFAAAWLTKGRAIFADLAFDLIALPSAVLAQRFRRGDGQANALLKEALAEREPASPRGG